MDERNGTPAHSPPDSALRRELMRPADARVPFVLALATALLAGVLGGYVLRASTEPTPEVIYTPAAAPTRPVIQVPHSADSPAEPAAPPAL